MLGAILGGASLLGSIFGGGARGAAQERAAQNQFIQGENNRTAQLYNTQQNALLNLLGLNEHATMNRAQMGLSAPSARAKQALLGSILSRMSPAQVQAPAGIPMGKMSGGLADALGGPGAKAAGNILQSQALQALLSKSDVPAAVDYTKQGMMPLPQFQGYRQAGRGESIMSLLGLIGGGAGALGYGLGRQGE